MDKITNKERENLYSLAMKVFNKDNKVVSIREYSEVSSYVKKAIILIQLRKDELNLENLTDFLNQRYNYSEECINNALRLKAKKLAKELNISNEEVEDAVATFINEDISKNQALESYVLKLEIYIEEK